MKSRNIDAHQPGLMPSPHDWSFICSLSLKPRVLYHSKTSIPTSPSASTTILTGTECLTARHWTMHLLLVRPVGCLRSWATVSLMVADCSSRQRYCDFWSKQEAQVQQGRAAAEAASCRVYHSHLHLMQTLAMPAWKCTLMWHC